MINQRFQWPRWVWQHHHRCITITTILLDILYTVFEETALTARDSHGMNLLHHVCKYRNKEVLTMLKKDHKHIYEKLSVTGDNKNQYPFTMVSSDKPEFLEHIYQVATRGGWISIVFILTVIAKLLEEERW